MGLKAVARLVGKFKCKEQRAKNERGEADTFWETSTPQRISEKKRRPSLPLLSGNSLKVHSQDSPK